MVSEPFNRHSDNDGAVKFSKLGSQPGPNGPEAVATFTDTAGNQVAQLTKKQIEAWLAKNARPPGMDADIPKEELAQGRDRIEHFEQRLFRSDILETPAPFSS